MRTGTAVALRTCVDKTNVISNTSRTKLFKFAAHEIYYPSAADSRAVLYKWHKFSGFITEEIHEDGHAFTGVNVSFDISCNPIVTPEGPIELGLTLFALDGQALCEFALPSICSYHTRYNSGIVELEHNQYDLISGYVELVYPEALCAFYRA